MALIYRHINAGLQSSMWQMHVWMVFWNPTLYVRWVIDKDLLNNKSDIFVT